MLTEEKQQFCSQSTDTAVRRQEMTVDCGGRGVTDCTSIKPLDLGALGPT